MNRGPSPLFSACKVRNTPCALLALGRNGRYSKPTVTIWFQPPSMREFALAVGANSHIRKLRFMCSVDLDDECVELMWRSPSLESVGLRIGKSERPAVPTQRFVAGEWVHVLHTEGRWCVKRIVGTSADIERSDAGEERNGVPFEHLTVAGPAGFAWHELDLAYAAGVWTPVVRALTEGVHKQAIRRRVEFFLGV